MSELPKGWEELPIGQVILPFRSTDPTKEPSKEFRYIDIGSIDNSCQAITDPKSFKGKDAPSRARRVVQEGDVLFSTVRTYLKNIATVPSELSGALTSTGIAVLRPSARMDSRYLFHWVASDAFITEISKSQDGTMYPAVSDRDVSSSRIAVPPLSEQHRIVTKLDSLTGHTARARGELGRIPRLVDKYRAAILSAAFSGELTREWRASHRELKPVSLRPTSEIRTKYRRSSEEFVPPFDVPRKWQWFRLPEIGDLDRGKSKHRPRNAAFLFGGPYPFVQTGEVRAAGQYLTTFSKTYSEAGLAQSRLWSAGTVCISIAANIAETAILAIDACFPDSVVGFTPDLDRTIGHFVEFFLRTARAELAAFAPATAQKNINLDTLGSIRLPVPPLSEQQEIVRRIETAFAWLDRVAAEHANASRLLPKLDQAILAKAFRGELVLSDRQPRTLADAES